MIGPGEVAIPGGREHTVRNESSAESSAFVVFVPVVQFERLAHGIELTRSLEEIR